MTNQQAIDKLQRQDCKLPLNLPYFMTTQTTIVITRSSGGGNGCILNVQQIGTPLTGSELAELVFKLQTQDDKPASD